MKKFLAVLLLVCVGSNLLAFSGKPSHTQTEIVTITKKKSVRVLYGVVLDANDAPIESANVDVLNNGEWIIKGQSESNVEQRILASVKTNAFGKFRFKNLSAGKYEVRFTATGFNELHIYVEVKSNSVNTKGVEIKLPLAN